MVEEFVLNSYEDTTSDMSVNDQRGNRFLRIEPLSRAEDRSEPAVVSWKGVILANSYYLSSPNVCAL